MDTARPHQTPLSVMIGTAGHVDHGKTSLVRCLTGFDTDRRPEERARGLSIDFDVAPFPLPDGRVAGIIDVPGHEDFVRNMVAGASSIDVLMLIVAADDAVMPQTVEHLKIARLMGMSALLTVITKIDLVDKEQLLLVEDDVRGFLAENGYADSPIYFASNTTGAGIEEIRQGVAALAAGIERKQSDKAFRMFVRVSFSMKGHGTVVTGVPCSGSIKAGDPLELLPSGEKLTLRSVQTYREEVEEAVSHRSSALNIREAPVSMFARGMTLCEPGVFRPTRSLLVHFDNLEDKPLKHRGEYRFHVGTAAIVCRIKTLHGEALSPRASGFLHLVLKEPCAVCAGDRFVLRSLSPASTLGGGLVLGANPGRVRRKDAEQIKERLLQAQRAVLIGENFLAELYASGSPILRKQDIPGFAQKNLQQAQNSVQDAVERGLLSSLGASAYLILSRKSELLSLACRLVSRYHSQNKLSQGMRPEFLTELLGLPSEATGALMGELTSGSELVLRHGFLALGDFKPEISEREFQLVEKLHALIVQAKEKGVPWGNVKTDLALGEKELKRASKLLIDQSKAVLIGNILLDAVLIAEYRRKLVEVFKLKGEVTLADFREKTGLSRNLSVPVLEFFDSEGTSKRVGAARVVVRKDLL